MMKLRLARPEVLIDINDLADLSYIRLDGDAIAIGAMTRHADLLDSPLLGEHYADLRRRRAGHRRPDRPQPGHDRRLALPGRPVRGPVRGRPRPSRAEIVDPVVRAAPATVPAREFHAGPYETVVGPAEILTEIRVPVRPGAGSAYEKVERRVGDWAVAAAGAFVTLDGDTVADVGIGLTAVGAPALLRPRGRGRPAGPAGHRGEPGRGRRGRGARSCNPSADQRGPGRLQAPPGAAS